MKRFLLSLLLWPCLGFAAPDLTSKEGLQTTCAELPADANALKTNAQRQAFAVCHDIVLVEQIVRWVKSGAVKISGGSDPQDLQTELHKEFVLVRDELKTTRLVLAKLKLKPGEGLMLAPGEWQRDLDGDGQVEPWEQFFFAIPKRGIEDTNFSMPSNVPGYYQQRYQLDARFRVDQSDVLWALAYHQFAEGLMEILLAHQISLTPPKGRVVELSDPVALLRAHRLIGEGLATSEALRRSLLAETDDANEWIPNPRQQHSVFPIALDQQAYETWARALSELTPLWAGKTLLVAEQNAGGLLGAEAKLCPQGEGLNIATLFHQPAHFPIAEGGLQSGCAKVDNQHPASGLVALINMVASRNSGTHSPGPEWQFVRYLYWVN